MSLSSLLQRLRQRAMPSQRPAADATPLSQSDVEATRVRARRRLIGMVVLVGAGVVGFPWLFETQPRALSPDVQIVQAPAAAGSEGGAAGGAPVHAVEGRVAVARIVPPPQASSVPDADADAKPQPQPAEPVPAQAPSRAATRDPATAPVQEAMRPVSRPQAEPPARQPADRGGKPPEKPADKSPDKPADKPKAVAAKPVDKPGTRYVVQFGAFADGGSAQQARMKVERLGIKTYAQQVDTPAGKRIRVRIGPFSDKAEADKAMATLRKAGMVAAVLTL